ncbi:vesicle transport protein GOT1B [Pongo abelii]|uniref:Golgi transport 1B n=1 Tax=Pongo abelii TaxID=9601 RepID=Q5R6R4_PONAB|nr:vesicle transport protein GOT1B [Pongo abelii]CAH92546.1 hypothetical protein [Pongo abelii]
MISLTDTQSFICSRLGFCNWFRKNIQILLPKT